MKKHSMPEMKEGGVNVTPLIDIVMCLIIFYMLVAHIAIDTGSDDSLRLPYSPSGKELKDPANTLALNVKEQGGEAIITAQDPQDLKVKTFHLDTMIDFLKRVRGENTQFKAIVRADKDLPYQFIEPVLLACARAKVKEYHFEATKKPPTGGGGAQ